MFRDRSKSFTYCLIVALGVVGASPATAAILSGPGGVGTPVGSSGLISSLDYSDTFTQTANGGAPGRPDTAAVQPYLPAYRVENSYNSGSAAYMIGAGFSFASDTLGVINGSIAYPGSSGAGSAGGFTQTGSAVDYGVTYGLRDEYIVQVDAVQTVDRIDISSGVAPGIFSPNSLSVFFRGNGSGNASLFSVINGVNTDTPIQTHIPTFNTGIPNQRTWHNYAVRYDRTNLEVEIYVDEVSKGVIDLTTFAGGIYQNFSNAYVGAGGAGGNRLWTDNLQIGGLSALAPRSDHPNPGQLPGLPSGLISYWNFDEAGGQEPGRGQNFAYDRQGINHGYYQGITERVPGLVGAGSVLLHDTVGEGILVGQGQNNSFVTPSGLSVEILFATNYDGTDQAEFYRKEDGNNRVLLSFQTDANTNNAFAQLIGTDAGFAGISFGINTAGYKEMDVALDGQNGRPLLQDLADGSVHHLVATYDAATGVKAMYIDGNLIGMIDGPDNVNIVNGGIASGFFGSTNGGEPFPGILDEAALWNRALTPAEIQAHYQNTLQGNNYFIPEPSTWALATLVLVAGAVYNNRRRNRSA